MGNAWENEEQACIDQTADGLQEGESCWRSQITTKATRQTIKEQSETKATQNVASKGLRPHCSTSTSSISMSISESVATVAREPICVCALIARLALKKHGASSVSGAAALHHRKESMGGAFTPAAHSAQGQGTPQGCTPCAGSRHSIWLHTLRRVKTRLRKLHTQHRVKAQHQAAHLARGHGTAKEAAHPAQSQGTASGCTPCTGSRHACSGARRPVLPAGSWTRGQKPRPRAACRTPRSGPGRMSRGKGRWRSAPACTRALPAMRCPLCECVMLKCV